MSITFIKPLFGLVWADSMNFVMASNSTGWSGFTLRQVVTAAGLALSGTIIRVTIASSSAAGCVVSKAYIGEAAAAGDQYDYAATPTQMLFSGLAGVTLGAGGSAVSDPLTFTLDETKNYVLAAHFSTTSAIASSGVATSCIAFSKAGDDVTTINATGYSSSGLNSLRLFKRIEVAV